MLHETMVHRNIAILQ